MLKGARATRRAARGAALVEFYVVALFALLPLTMGILQAAVLVAARNVVNHATYMAARAGAMDHARRGTMEAALARGLLPLHADTSEELDAGNVVGVVAEAYVRARANVAIFADLQVLNPVPASFEDFGTQAAGVTSMRNDSLEFRELTRGARSGQTILEANLLQIRVRYCQPLVFPVIDKLLLVLLRSRDTDLFHQRCYAAGRVPLAATGTIHMQSDAELTSL